MNTNGKNGILLTILILDIMNYYKILIIGVSILPFSTTARIMYANETAIAEYYQETKHFTTRITMTAEWDYDIPYYKGLFMDKPTYPAPRHSNSVYGANKKGTNRNVHRIRSQRKM